jgi:hypothetical protein
VTLESWQHPRKEYFPIVSTDDGMAMARNNGQSRNASSSISRSLESGSNVTDESFAHDMKQAVPNVVTEDGMQMRDSDEHPQNADLAIVES